MLESTVLEWYDPEEYKPGVFEQILICREGEKGKYRVEAGCLCRDGSWKVYGTHVKKIACWARMPRPPYCAESRKD